MTQAVKEIISLIANHAMTITGAVILVCGLFTIIWLLHSRGIYKLVYILLVVYIVVMLLLLVPDIVNIVNFITGRL